MKKLSASQMTQLFSAMSNGKPLYIPARRKGLIEFSLWASDLEYCLDELHTAKSPKDFFFPQSENLVAFRTQGKTISITPNIEPTEPFVLFGVRPCDVKGLAVLDKVFLSDPVDSFYKAKRESGIVIAMACNEPEETCFCGAFGIDAVEPVGDVVTWMLDGVLYWDAQTEKGRKLTEEAASLFEEATEADHSALAQHKAEVGAILESLPLANLRPEEIGGDLLALFGSGKWAELSQACLGCGACTFVCPTCQCYDIQDFDTGHGVQRFRCWDSCMYSDFTMMAHGNPRTSQLERFRQRFMHKLVYFPENNGGEYSCVGCGRCVAKCPVSLNIAKVIKALGGKEHVL